MKAWLAAFVCLSLTMAASEALRLPRRSAASLAFTDEDDATLLTDSAPALDDASLLAAASSAKRVGVSGGAGAGAAAGEMDGLVSLLSSSSLLGNDLGDDLSADSALSDTLNHLLTKSEIDAPVSGDAFGDEPLTSAHSDESEADAAELHAAHAHAPEPTPKLSAVFAAPVAPVVPVVPKAVVTAPAMSFRQVSAGAAEGAAAESMAAAKKGPITPLKTHNTKEAVPVPSLPSHTEEAHGVAKKHAKQHAPSVTAAVKAALSSKGSRRARDNAEESEDESESTPADMSRFMADRALNAAMSRMMTPDYATQQRALASQGGTDPNASSTSAAVPATSERVKAAIWVVLALGAVVAVVEASTSLADYALKNANVTMDRMLSKTYRAILLLGLVSLLLVCFARFGWLHSLFGDYSPNLLYDLMIVMLAMGFLYLVVMCAMVGYVMYSVAQYKAIELKYRTDNDRNRLENTLNKMRDDYNARSCCSRTFGCFASYNLRAVEFEYYYLSIKKEFVKQHYRRFFAPLSAAAAAGSVPPQSGGQVAASQAVTYQNFEFHVYLRKAMQQVMEEVAAVHWQVWCVVFVVVLLNALRMLAFKSVDASSFVYLSVIVLWLVMLFTAVMVYSISGATEELAEHYSVYLPERDAGSLNDDPDAELLREANFIEGGGCCGRACMCCAGCKTMGCCSAPNKQQEMFWCKTPSSVTKGLQAAVLLTCLVLPAYIVDMSDFVLTQSTTTRYALNVCLVIPPLLSLVFLIPMVLPRFLLATSVASMSRLAALRTTILKLNSTSYRTEKLEADKARAAEGGKKGGANGALSTEFDDAHSIMSEDDDDDSDIENDSKSQRSDNDGPYHHHQTVAMGSVAHQQ